MSNRVRYDASLRVTLTLSILTVRLHAGWYPVLTDAKKENASVAQLYSLEV